MNRQRMNRFTQQGLSLVELMIAITLGLMISAAAIQMFIASKNSFQTVEKNSNIQENHRFSIENLERGLHLAGYIENVQLLKYSQRYQEIFRATGSIWQTSQTLWGDSTSLRVRYQMTGPSVNLCNVNTLVPDNHVVEVYYVFGAGELDCSSNIFSESGALLTANPAVLVADGIKSMTFNYYQGTSAVSPVTEAQWRAVDSVQVVMTFSNGSASDVKYVDLIELPNN